ncbi:MAG: hypothetical protein LUH08_00050, partial [Ruminococcus sp.]|nr:hypothetical protein [Ruminococcus sp.]
MFRDAYISFSDASRELYDMLAERNGVIPADKETITESAIFTSLGLYNLVLNSSIIDESRAIYYISDYSHTLEDLFAVVEVYCRLYDEDDYERVSEDSETSGFYHRASQLLWIYLDGVDLSHDASEIDITYITSTLGYFLAYKLNIEAIGVEAYEGDSQKQAQLDDFFEQATKL